MQYKSAVFRTQRKRLYRNSEIICSKYHGILERLIVKRKHLFVRKMYSDASSEIKMYIFYPLELTGYIDDEFSCALSAVFCL